MHLDEIANRCGSDKGTLVGNAHGYTAIYDLLFRPFRDQPISLLELGLAIGGPEHGASVDRPTTSAPSVEMWLDYFSAAHIVGFDICDFSWLRRNRFSFIRGDSGSATDLAALRPLGPFDIVIDDASHASFHQQLAFAEIFPMVKPGGLYIIEDLDWQPPEYEAKLPPVPRTVDVLRSVVDGEAANGTPTAMQHALADVASITLFDRAQLSRASRIMRTVPEPTPRPRPWYKLPKPPKPPRIKLAIIQKRP